MEGEGDVVAGEEVDEAAKVVGGGSPGIGYSDGDVEVNRADELLVAAAWDGEIGEVDCGGDIEKIADHGRDWA
jgi:hypothetical protein